MKDILETIIKTLVDNKAGSSCQGRNSCWRKERRACHRRKDWKGSRKEDRSLRSGGIWKEGKMAKAIRTVLKAIGTKEQKKVNVEFID